MDLSFVTLRCLVYIKRAWHPQHFGKHRRWMLISAEKKIMIDHPKGFQENSLLFYQVIDRT